jgi:DNA repair protein RecO (recombination protein O)
MKDVRTEGVILRALDFQEHHQILTLFSPDCGIVKIITKSFSKARLKKGDPRLSPLVQVDCLYAIGNHELCKCQEISIINPFLELRTSFSCLNTACQLAQSILQSQLGEKPAPLLYQLFISCLKKLPSLAHYDTLTSCFRLKILKHEGYIGDQISQFKPEEIKIANQLLNCRSFAELDALIPPLEFHEKVKSYFINQIS